MITIENILGGYARNVEIIKMQTENITHEESLIQLPFRSNCLNWVVGHVLANRCNILDLLGADDLRPGLDLEKETEVSLQRAAPYRDRAEKEIAYWIFFLYFHDSYHVGQTEILRQAAGKDDKII